jgi:hypothetical protein
VSRIKWIPGNAKYAVLFELDRGMEFQQKFKEHVKGRLELIRSGQYAKLFGVPGVIVSYVTTGQTPQYRNTRVKTMNAWTREVLAELNLKNWGGYLDLRVLSLIHSTTSRQVCLKSVSGYGRIQRRSLDCLTRN